MRKPQSKLAAHASDLFYESMLFILTLGLGRWAFLNRSRNALQAIISTESADTDQLRDRIRAFVKEKHKESQYIQIAGTVMFASVISCLQWNFTGVNWSARALFYSTILFSLNAIILGALQSVALPDHEHPNSIELVAMRNSLTAATEDELENAAAKDEPEKLPVHKGLLIALQCPLITLNSSLWAFFAALFVVVYSPIVPNQTESHPVKVAVVFSVANFVQLLLYILFVIGIRRVPKTEGSTNSTVRVSPVVDSKGNV